MKVNLLTDAPKHNLALMKISTYHKQRGDSVTLGKPQDSQLSDRTYASWLFSKSPKYPADLVRSAIALEQTEGKRLLFKEPCRGSVLI